MVNWEQVVNEISGERRITDWEVPACDCGGTGWTISRPDNPITELCKLTCDICGRSIALEHGTPNLPTFTVVIDPVNNSITLAPDRLDNDML